MLAFAHLRKSAGSTMLSILRRNFGARMFESRGFAARADLTGDDLCRVRRVYRHLDCIAGEKVSPAGDLYPMHPYLRFFTFVRDPISRCVSDFQWRLNCIVKYHYPGVPKQWLPAKWRVPGDLREFARQCLLGSRQQNLQTQHIAGCQDADRAIEILHERVGFVGMVERFDESVLMWREWTGRSGLDIAYRRHNVAAEGKYPRQKVLRQLMAEDAEIARLVTEGNELDQQLYDHVRGELFPAQAARYERALRAAGRPSLALRRRWDAGTLNLARRWMFRTLVYKPLRPMLFRRAS